MQERIKITNGGLIGMGKVVRAWEGLNDNVAPPSVHNSIQPVTDADRMLQSTGLFELAINLDVTVGQHVVAMTVPTGKRRTLVMAGRGGSTGSTTLAISDGTTTITITNAGTSSEKLLGINIPMEQGWTLGLTATDNVADTAQFVSCIFIEEDAFLS